MSESWWRSQGPSNPAPLTLEALKEGHGGYSGEHRPLRDSGPHHQRRVVQWVRTPGELDPRAPTRGTCDILTV